MEILLLDDEPELHPERTVSLTAAPEMITKSASSSPTCTSDESFHPSIFDDDDCLEPLDTNAYDFEESFLICCYFLFSVLLQDKVVESHFSK